MATVCAKPFHGKAMRVTKLDACGTPVEGTCSTVVSKGFVTVTNSYVYRDPDEIEVVNANGDLCISERGRSLLKWIESQIVFCEVDPDLINLLTGDPVVLDDTAPTPRSVGYRVDSALEGLANFALEVWTDLSGQPCDAAGNVQYGYFLMPFYGNGFFSDDLVFQNGEASVTVSANTKAGSQWGVGPYNVRGDATLGTPEPLLTAIGANVHQHFEVVSIAPPTAACGCVALVIP